MLTLLLGKRGHSSHSIPNAPLIEAIDGEFPFEGYTLISIVTMATGDKLVETAASDDDHYDWEMDQVLPAAEEKEVSILMGTLFG